MNAIELTVRCHPTDEELFAAFWSDGNPQIAGVPMLYLDLLPAMSARRLLCEGYPGDTPIVIRMQNGDRDMARGPLCVVAAAAPSWTSALKPRTPKRRTPKRRGAHI
jgi:hypothetical protein